MAKPVIAGLVQFLRKTDRVPPAYFAGRKKLIDKVDEALEAVMVEAGKPDGDASGLTMLFQGAPGAGKTALLGELARRFREQEVRRLTDTPTGPAEGVPVPVMLERDILYNEGSVALAIVQAMAEAPGGPGDAWTLSPEAFRRTVSHTLSGKLGAGGIGVGGGRTTSTAPETPAFAMLRKKQPPATWARPVVLLVDEIQAVDPAAKEVLNKLHNAMRGLPVLTVLAGLGDSYDHLRQAAGVGLTRFGMGTIRDIGLLAPEEAEEAVLGFFEAFHVDLEGADPRAWAERLAQESDGWPQHLHNGQRALAEGLVEADGRLADVDAVRVLDRAVAFREAAYRRQISPAMEDARRLSAAVMKDVGAGIEGAAVLDSIDARTHGGPETLRHCPGCGVCRKAWTARRSVPTWSTRARCRWGLSAPAAARWPSAATAVRSPPYRLISWRTGARSPRRRARGTRRTTTPPNPEGPAECHNKRTLSPFKRGVRGSGTVPGRFGRGVRHVSVGKGFSRPGCVACQDITGGLAGALLAGHAAGVLD